MTKCNIAISTVQRPNKTPYLERLITSIRQDYGGVIHLVIGGKDTAYTDKYQEGFVKIFIGEEEEQYHNNIQKAGYGYFRCLTLDRTRPLLVLEDDGVLEPGWYKKLQQLITFTAEERFILSLITPGEGTVSLPMSTVPSIQLFNYRAFLDYKIPGQIPEATIITYCNTTGVYYPASLLQTRLPEFILTFAANGDAVHDIVLGHYMFRYNFPIYIAVPNLLQSVDSSDSSLGSEKSPSTMDYSTWDYLVL